MMNRYKLVEKTGKIIYLAWLVSEIAEVCHLDDNTSRAHPGIWLLKWSKISSNSALIKLLSALSRHEYFACVAEREIRLSLCLSVSQSTDNRLLFRKRSLIFKEYTESSKRYEPLC